MAKRTRDPQRTNGPVRVTSNGTGEHTCSCACGRTWSPRASKPAHTCVCAPGCEAQTKRTFAQGHDAKAYAFLRQLRANDGRPKTAADLARVAHLRDAGVLTGLLAHLS